MFAILLLVADMARQVPLCMRKCLSCRFKWIYLHPFQCCVEPITTIMSDETKKKSTRSKNRQSAKWNIVRVFFFSLSIHFIYHEIFLLIWNYSDRVPIGICFSFFRQYFLVVSLRFAYYGTCYGFDKRFSIKKKKFQKENDQNP